MRPRAILKLPVLASLAAMACPGQSLTVYSELQRTDLSGQVISSDRGPASREILSPELARNAYTSFQIVLSMPAGSAYALYFGENPEHSARAELWREVYQKQGNSSIPDRLIGISTPYKGKMDQPGQTSQAFWLDVWVEPDSPIRRIKIEPEVWIGDRWLTYPMEARIVAAAVPRRYAPGPSPASAGAPADETARRLLAAWLCGRPEPAGRPGPANLRDFLVRNARQDTGLAERVGRDQIWRTIGVSDHSAWCANPTRPQSAGAEWYFKVRDAVYRAP